jgi:hypothetical protein
MKSRQLEWSHLRGCFVSGGSLRIRPSRA